MAAVFALDTTAPGWMGRQQPGANAAPHLQAPAGRYDCVQPPSPLAFWWRNFPYASFWRLDGEAVRAWVAWIAGGCRHLAAQAPADAALHPAPHPAPEQPPRPDQPQGSDQTPASKKPAPAPAAPGTPGGGKPAEPAPAQPPAAGPSRPSTPAPQPPQQPAPAQPAQPQEPAGISSMEAEMLRLLNAERAKAGARPLVMDPVLVKVARLKSQDMVRLGYFGHNSPTYGSPFAMLKAFGVSYRTAGENLAGNPTVAGAHASLMNSPGHRRNLLNPAFGRVGIGIVRGGPYGLMITQLFTD